MAENLRILTFSSLFPNAVQPGHGVFVENRLRHLVDSGQVAARVVAPVPWFPFRHACFGRYADMARVSMTENRFGLEVCHPRFLVIPKIGMNMTPRLMYRAVLAEIESGRIRRDDFDLIDAHYFYPDGVAAALLAEKLDKPLVITARGTDINLIADLPSPRRQILAAASRAQAVIAVSAALKARMEQIGIDPARITVLRNGVALSTFTMTPRKDARLALGLEDGPLLLAVGNILASKGQDVAIRALTLLPDARLLIIGSGADQAAFEQLAINQGVGDRVRFVGRVAQDALSTWYSAADISLLPSMREGWPNVLLESLACGTPVVATDVGGVAEIIAAPEAGLLVPDRTPEALAAAVKELMAQRIDPAVCRRYAEGFSWDATTKGQIDLFAGIIGS
jgi:glycosyltransferase involved in cell wall biosynthesis